MVCPPVVTVSVTVGTVPVSCSACSDRAGTAACTPLILATSDTASCGKVMSVPLTKKSLLNWVPGGPSLARSVSTDELLLSRALASDALAPAAPDRRRTHRPPARHRHAPPPPKPRRRWSSWSTTREVLATPTVRSTRMLVPTLDSGDRTCACALERPLDTPTMPMTSPTPMANPRAVTNVRLQRRRSSCHTYPNENTLATPFTRTSA